MDIDVTAHGVAVAEAVEAGFGAGQSEDAGQDPVAFGLGFTNLRGIDLKRKTGSDTIIVFPRPAHPL